MKMVIAYVQPSAAADVVHALHQVRGLTGASFVNVRGFGRGREARVNHPPEVLLEDADRVRIEVMIRDELEDEVVKVILTTARTGNSDGDGKIYLAGFSRAVRIATGEEGETAI